MKGSVHSCIDFQGMETDCSKKPFIFKRIVGFKKNRDRSIFALVNTIVAEVSVWVEKWWGANQGGGVFGGRGAKHICRGFIERESIC